MGTNGNGQFLESELIHRKVKVGNEWQTRIFPVVGGRLRGPDVPASAQAVTGLGLLALLSLVPVLGEALLALLGLIGIGALIVSLVGARGR